MMQGVHVEVTKLFSRTSQNYVITSRIIQGQRDMRDASPEERNDIVARWHGQDMDLKGFQSMKRREKTAQKAPMSPYQHQQHSSSSGALSSGSSGGWQSLLSSNEGLARLASRKDGWLRGIGHTGSGSNLSVRPNTADDAEFEHAIQASVRETSRGNPKEDAAVEAAIRQSVNAVRQQGALPEPVRTEAHLDKKDPTIFEDAEYQITDEEYQALIEQAIHESMAGQSEGASLPHDSGFAELDATAGTNQASGKGSIQAPTVAHGHAEQEDDEDLRKAIEESKNLSARPSVSAAEDDEYERAIAASKEETDREKSQRTEEDIVMEYVKKQSLAEAEYLKQREGAKGKAPAIENANDDEDEDLKRALEESLKMSQGDGSGPSQMHGS